MPLLNESINSPSMVCHCINIICQLTAKLNPFQLPVITADQPVYALAKKVQWMQPLGLEDCVIMFGPLHIEMDFLAAIGNWLESSGWTTVFEKAQFSTVGRIESFLSGSKVKRSRYAHQVSLSALVTMARTAHESEIGEQRYEEWRDNLCQKSATASYWFTVMDLEILLFIFVRSIREGDFNLFITSLKSIAHWIFALDHVHYARWLPVFIEDMINISKNNEKNTKAIFNSFNKGFFTVRKTNNPFSSIGIDQAHEQNNKIIKVDGGAIGLLENDNALLK